MKTQSIRTSFSSNGRTVELKNIDYLDANLIQIAELQPGEVTRGEKDYLLLPESTTSLLIRRLVVIVPSGELDEIWLGMQVSKLALRVRTSILFLALASSPETDFSLRRRLVTLTSLVKDAQITTCTRLSLQEGWKQAVKEILHEGDLLVCMRGHRISDFIFRKPELAPLLVSALGVPTYVLTGNNVLHEPMEWDRWRELFVWVSSFMVILLFGFFQAFINRTLQGAGATLVLCLSVIVEGLLLWKLNFLG